MSLLVHQCSHYKFLEYCSNAIKLYEIGRLPCLILWSWNTYPII